MNGTKVCYDKSIKRRLMSKEICKRPLNATYVNENWTTDFERTHLSSSAAMHPTLIETRARLGKRRKVKEITGS